MPSAPVPASTRVSLSGSTSGPSSTTRPSTAASRSRASAHGGERGAEQRLAVALEECPRGVGARQDRAGRAGGGGRLHAGVEAGRVEPLGAREHQCRLAPRRQGLVRADDHRVRAELERVPRQVGVEPEVRRPRSVDDERDVVRVGRVREPGDVADRADVRRVAHEHGPRVGVLGRARRPRSRARRRAAARWRGRPRAAPRRVRGPASTRPSSIERCRVRLTTTRSPSPPSARATAWLACVAPPTENRQTSAPHSRAARDSASASTPRESFMVSRPAYSGTSPATTSPTRSCRCLWPGIVNGVGRLLLEPQPGVAAAGRRRAGPQRVGRHARHARARAGSRSPPPGVAP